MPQVLHVISGLGVGGAEMALYRLVANAKDGCYKHTVVALTPGGAMEDRLRNAGIELTTFDFKTAPISHFFNLLLLMRRSRPDIVQTWMYHADMLGGMAARLSGNRNIIWGVRTSELTAGSAQFTAVVRKACAFLSRWIPHTIVCVAEAARSAHVHDGYDPKRMVVVPNGFDLSRLVADDESLRELRERCGFGEDDVVVGTVGRFNVSKDQANFIRAAGILARRHVNLRFLMVGRGLEAHNAELMRWISETGFPERFVLLGERADVPICLAAMDIFCLSSRNEGFPNVAGEAMAMGLPCVVTDVGDAALLVGDAGVVVPKENSEALAHGIDTLLGMTQEGRRKLGLRARERIHAEFTVERTRERFEALYQRLTKESES